MNHIVLRHLRSRKTVTGNSLANFNFTIMNGPAGVQLFFGMGGNVEIQIQILPSAKALYDGQHLG